MCLSAAEYLEAFSLDVQSSQEFHQKCMREVSNRAFRP